MSKKKAKKNTNGYQVESGVKKPKTPKQLERRRMKLAMKIAQLRITHNIYQKDIAEAADMTEPMLSLTLSGHKKRTLEHKLDRVEAAVDELVEAA